MVKGHPAGRSGLSSAAGGRDELLGHPFKRQLDSDRLGGEWGDMVFLEPVPAVLHTCGVWENPCLGNCVWYISAVLIVNAVFAAGQEVFLIGTGVGLGNSVPLLGYGGWMFGIIWGLLDMKGEEARSGIFDKADRKIV